ncbi:hypothetical protein ABZP36_025584 [Zizania latifolia]
MTSDNGKAPKEGGEASGLPSGPLEGEISNEPQRRRPLNGRTTGLTRQSTKGNWTPEEDAILSRAVQTCKGKNWKKIECFPDRTDVQCLHRWQKVLNPELVKGPWSKEEDEIIVQMLKPEGGVREGEVNAATGEVARRVSSGEVDLWATDSFGVADRRAASYFDYTDRRAVASSLGGYFLSGALL